MSNITLGVASEADAARLLEIYAPYVVNTAITFEYDVPTLDEFKSRIAHTLEFYPYITASADGKIIGYAYIGRFRTRAAYDWNAETSVYVEESLTHSGVGKLLCTALEDIAREQNILALDACITVPHGEPDAHANNNSSDFHKHIGYTQVARFAECGYKYGKWYDMVWLEKPLSPHTPTPKAIIPFKETQWYKQHV